MAETPTSQDSFRAWTEDERIRTPHATVNAIRQMIDDHVAPVAARDQTRAEEMVAALYEIARMHLLCTDPVGAVKEACVQAQERYFVLLNLSSEQKEQNLVVPWRKAYRGAKRMPAFHLECRMVYSCPTLA